MLRVFYFCLASLLCLSLAGLGLWPWAIKPRLHGWMSHKLRVAGVEHGLILRTDAFNVTGFSEIELIGARVEDVNKRWSVEAPLVSVQVSVVALIFGAQPLRRVHLISPVVMGSIESSGPSGVKLELPPGLKEVSVDNGLIQLEDPSRKASVQVSYLNARVRKRFSQYQVSLTTPQVVLEVDGKVVSSDRVSFAGFLVDGKSGKSVNIRSLDLNTTLGSLLAQGRIELDGGFGLRSASALNVHSKLNLHQLGSWLSSGTQLNGSLFASIELGLDKDSKALKAQGIIGGRDVGIDDVTVEMFDSELSFANDIIQISQIEALFGGTLVRAEAEIQPRKQWQVGVYANFVHMSLFDLLSDIGVKGAFVDMALDARLEAKGQLWPNFSLAGKMSAEGRNFLVANQNARKARDNDQVLLSEGTIHLESGLEIDTLAFRFRDAVVSDGLSTIATNCSLHFDSSKGLSVDVQGQHFDFRSIGEKLAEQSYAGSGRFSGSVNGPYDTIRIAGNADFNTFSYEGFDFGKLASRIFYEGDDLVFSDVHGETSSAQLRGALTLRFHADTKLDLRVEHFALKFPEVLKHMEHAPLAKPYIPTLEAVFGNATGSVYMQGPAASNRLSELQGTLQVSFAKGIQLNTFEFDSVEIALTSSQNSWNIDKATAQIGKARLSASGGVSKNNLESSLAFAADALDLSDLIDAEGVFEAQVALNGSLHRPKVAGRIVLTNLESNFVAFGNQELGIATNDKGHLSLSGQLFSSKARVDGEVELDLAKRKAKLNDILIKGEKGDEIRLAGLWDYQGKTNIRVFAALELGNLALPNDSFEAMRGSLVGEATLSGDLLDPIWKGNVDVRNAYVIHNMVTQPIEDLSAHLALTGKEVVLDSLKGRSGRGTLEGHGWIVLDGFMPGEIESRFTLNTVPFQSANMLSGSATGFLEFRKLDDELSLSGDLRIKEGFVASDLKLDDFKFQSNGYVSGNPIRMDIRIRTEEPVRMDTDFVSGELDGNLHVVGNHLSPGLIGSIELKGGRANFRNHEYDLRKARIDFDDSFHIVPRLDIVATGEIDDYAIQALLRGTPERPQMRLTSDPYLPESQLLVLMSLGYATQDVKGVAATARTTGLEALSLYLGLGHNVMRFLNRHGSSDFLQLEDLSLSSIFSKSDGVNLPALRIGMNVWSGLKLRMHSALVENEANKREQRVELEQSLGHQMKWRLGWDSDGTSNYGDAGFDVWYRWEVD